MSLFVPHVFPNFTKEYVSGAFSDIGNVERIDFVAKLDRNGKQYNAAYVHFSSWHDNSQTRHFQQEMLTNGQTKMHHDNSEYYWIVLPNTATKNDPFARKPRIELDNTKSVNLSSIVPEKCLFEDDFPSLPSKNTPIEKNPDEFFETIDDAQMDEIEEELEKVDENLISIDYRYVKVIEEENQYLRGEIAQLRMLLINLDQTYQAEKAKVRAFITSVDL